MFCRKKTKPHPEVVDIASQAQEQMDTLTLPRANLSAVSSSSNIADTVKPPANSTILLSPSNAAHRALTSPKQAITNLGKTFSKIKFGRLRGGPNSAGGSGSFMPSVWYSKAQDEEEGETDEDSKSRDTSRLSLETAQISGLGIAGGSTDGLSTLPRQYSNSDIIDALARERAEDDAADETDDALAKSSSSIREQDDFVMDSCGVLATNSDQMIKAMLAKDNFRNKNVNNQEAEEINEEELRENLLRRRHKALGENRAQSLDCEQRQTKGMSLPLTTNENEQVKKPEFFIVEGEKLGIGKQGDTSQSAENISVTVQDLDSNVSNVTGDLLKPSIERTISKSAGDLVTQPEELENAKKQSVSFGGVEGNNHLLAATTRMDIVSKSADSLIIVTDAEDESTVIVDRIDSEDKVAELAKISGAMNVSKSASSTPMVSQPGPEQTWVDAAATHIYHPSMKMSFSEGSLATQLENQENPNQASVNPFSKLKVKMSSLALPPSPQTKRRLVNNAAKEKRQQSEQEFKECQSRIILL